MTLQKGEAKSIALDRFTDEIIVSAGARLELRAVDREGWGERQTLTITLDGDGADVTFVCVLYGREDSVFPFDVRVDHRAPNTKSRIAIRSVLYGTSSVDSNGIVHIAENATGSDTFFSHHALLLGDDARATAIPSLEIENNDVKAGHAVTVGRLNDEILFACASRGLDRAQAEEVLVSGFLNADAHLIESRETRELFENMTDFSLTRGYCLG